MFDETKPSPRAATTAVTQRRNGETTVDRRIGQYHLRRVIASGGMGTVYEAVQEHPRRTVAVKLVRQGLTSPAALRRFGQEAQILARLQHPWIAQVYDAGMHQDEHGLTPYFVMEYIAGAKPITRYADAHELGTRQRLELFAKACEAVHYGHSKGVIHRDLKPENILVDASGTPKVIDFGVARATDADRAVTTLQTNVGELIGTLQYMSPEQVEGDPHIVDARSDVYELGMVLYELLTGKPPYSLDKLPLHEAIKVILETPPAPLSSIDTRFRGDLETIITKALHKDRSRRYGSAADLADDLRRYVAGDPIIARRDSATYLIRVKARQALSRHPHAAALVIIAFAYLFADIVGVAFAYRWRPADALFKQAVVALTSSPAVAPAVPGSGPVEPLERVRIIRITDETVARLSDLAAAQGIEGVDPRQLWTARSLHGRLMERLATVDPAAVVWDFNFPGERSTDAGFVRGAQALRDAGIEVIVTVESWPLDPGQRPLISENIAPYVRWGGTTVYYAADAPWETHLFAARKHVDRPSLVLTTVAAVRQPGWAFDFHLAEGGKWIELRFQRLADSSSPTNIEYGSTLQLPLTSFATYVPTITTHGGLREGDMVGSLLIHPPSDEVLAASSLDYEWVLTASEEDLAGELRQKIVLIGNFQCNAPDRFLAPDGRTLAGAVGLAESIERLMEGSVLRTERLAFSRPMLLITVIAGVALVLGIPGQRRWLRASLLLAAVGVIVLIPFVAYREGYLVNPLVPLIGLVTAYVLAVPVQRLHHEIT